jgi:type I restriction enzyme S subunit
MADQTTTIPKGWKMTTLGEVAEINSSTIDVNYVFDEIEYIDVASVEERKLTETQKLKLENAPSRAKRIVTDNSVLISTVRPNLKHYCFIKKAKPNLIASTGFAVVNSKEGKSDPYFLYNLLTTNDFTNFLVKVADSQTSTYPAFNPSIIQNSKFALPSYPEQRAIAAVLSSLDDKIELLREENKTLEATAQAIFKEWFVNFNFPDSEGKPYKASGGKMIPSELGDIPEGWRVEEIYKIVDFVGGSQPPKSEHIYEPQPGYIRFVQNRDYSNDSHITYIKESKKNKICEPLDIMMDKYGEVGVPRYGIAGAYNVALAKIVPKIKDSREYLRSYFSQPKIFNLLNASAQASTRGSLNSGTFRGLKIVLPGKEVLKKYEELQSLFLRKILFNNSQIQTLSSLRDTLLPKLMKGEIRVKGFGE